MELPPEEAPVLLAPRTLPMSHLLLRARTISGAALLLAVPHGGQRVARRNAWAGVAEGLDRARAHREAQVAVDVAARAVAGQPGPCGAARR